MHTLILGGAASGKSSFAEKYACDCARKKNASLVYVATLNPDAGGDTAERIQKHRAARAGKGFVTAEWWDCSVTLSFDAQTVVLVEDFGNLVANYLFPQGKPPLEICADSAVGDLLRLLQETFSQCADCICVSNEISLGGNIPDDLRLYAETLAKLNVRWAALCDEVYAVVAGIPVRISEAATKH